MSSQIANYFQRRVLRSMLRIVPPRLLLISLRVGLVAPQLSGHLSRQLSGQSRGPSTLQRSEGSYRIWWPAAILIGSFLWLGLGPLSASCWAVTILLKDNPAPVKGFLVSESDARVVVDELLPDGKLERRTLPRSAIDLIIQPIAADRLAALDRNQPQTYRDYADELSEKREDPEARATALRLYLITAALDPQGQGRGCLLGMAALARNEDEQRRFRAMAYLLDPDHDRAVLKTPDPAPAVQIAGLNDTNRNLVLSALQALRTGDKSKVLAISRRPNFAEAWQPVEKLLPSEEMLESARSANPILPTRLLKKTLQVELLLRGGSATPIPHGETTSSPAPTAAAEPSSAGLTVRPWSQRIAAHRLTPVTTLTLDTITEFDPRANRFHDGRWIVPE